MNVELMMQRQALSGRAWDTARWRDGRRVIVAPFPDDMAMQQPRCRVLPGDQRGHYVPSETSGLGEYVYTDPEPMTEAVETTWEAVATELLKPSPKFG